MQTCLLVLGIVLAGQLSDSSGSRYSTPSTSPSTSPSASQPPFVGSPTTGSRATGSRDTGATANGLRANDRRANVPLVNDLRVTDPLANGPASSQPESTHQSAGTGRLAKVIQPAELLSTLAKAAGTEQLAGAPLSLETAVQKADTRAEQTRCVQLYWELSQAVAQHQLVTLEAVQLSSIYGGLGLTDPNQAQQRQAWQLAQQSIAARSQVARSAVRLAQLRLQKVLVAPPGLDRARTVPLPIPSDLPFCGAYQTHFSEIFQGSPAAEAEQLSQLLPLLHQELGRRASDTIAAHQWYNVVSQQRSPQSDGTPLLKAYEHLALQRRAFVAAAYQYNANIARYTALAVPQNVGTVRLVAMLIESEPRSSADLSRAGLPAGGNGSSAESWQSGAVRRANAQQALPGNGSPAGNGFPLRNRQTYDEQERSKALRVPASQEKQEAAERSILIPPSSPQP